MVKYTLLYFLCNAEDKANACIPWTIKYDEVLIVFEGRMRIHADGEIYELRARDSLWLLAGTELIYEAEEALVAYAIHPSNWQEV